MSQKTQVGRLPAGFPVSCCVDTTNLWGHRHPLLQTEIATTDRDNNSVLLPTVPQQGLDRDGVKTLELLGWKKPQLLVLERREVRPRKTNRTITKSLQETRSCYYMPNTKDTFTI